MRKLIALLVLVLSLGISVNVLAKNVTVTVKKLKKGKKGTWKMKESEHFLQKKLKISWKLAYTYII